MCVEGKSPALRGACSSGMSGAQDSGNSPDLLGQMPLWEASNSMETEAKVVWSDGEQVQGRHPFVVPSAKGFAFWGPDKEGCMG